MSARISIDDLALAHEFIYKSTNTGKWNKPHWQAAASAMAWFIRELPGSPVLMNRVLKLMRNHPDATLAMSEATNLIRAQSLDASILNVDTGVGRSLEEVLEEDLEDLEASPITSGQPDATAGHLAGADDDVFKDCDDGGADDAGILRAPGRTSPPTTTPAPAAATAVAARRAVVGAVGAAAAAAGGATNKYTAANPAHVHKTIPDVHKTAQKIPVCKYLWRRMLCRKPGCAFRHPDLCANPTCIPTRTPGCARFHGRFREDKEDTAHKTNTVRTKKDNNPVKKSSQRPAQGNGRRGGPPQSATPAAGPTTGDSPPHPPPPPEEVPPATARREGSSRS